MVTPPSAKSFSALLAILVFAGIVCDRPLEPEMDDASLAL